MRKRELIALWIISLLLGAELLILWFLIYFANLPFFLFLFTVALRILSIFSIGVITLLLVLVIVSIRPGEPFESWKAHFKEYLRFFLSSFFLSCLMAIACLALGALVCLLLKRVFLLPSFKDSVSAIKNWVAEQFY